MCATSRRLWRIAFPGRRHLRRAGRWKAAASSRAVSGRGKQPLSRWSARNRNFVTKNCSKVSSTRYPSRYIVVDCMSRGADSCRRSLLVRSSFSRDQKRGILRGRPTHWIICGGAASRITGKEKVPPAGAERFGLLAALRSNCLFYPYIFPTDLLFAPAVFCGGQLLSGMHQKAQEWPLRFDLCINDCRFIVGQSWDRLMHSFTGDVTGVSMREAM